MGSVRLRLQLVYPDAPAPSENVIDALRLLLSPDDDDAAAAEWRSADGGLATAVPRHKWFGL
jgi:hypothetical protein